MINMFLNKEKRLWLKECGKFGVLLVLFVFCFSCKSNQLVSEKSIVDKTTIDKSTTEDVKSEETTEKETIIFEKDDVEISGVIYDTEKPPDPTTGKPPILFEGTIKKKQDATVTQSETNNKQSDINKTEDIKKQNNVQESIDVKEETNKRIPAFYHWSAAVLITLVVFFLIYIIKKRFL